MRTTIGERIKLFRERLNMTQAELAKICFKRNHVQVYHWESGRTSIRDHDIPRLCRALNIDPNTLFDFDENK